jgi:hypothetical protein
MKAAFEFLALGAVTLVTMLDESRPNFGLKQICVSSASRASDRSRSKDQCEKRWLQFVHFGPILLIDRGMSGECSESAKKGRAIEPLRKPGWPVAIVRVSF